MEEKVVHLKINLKNPCYCLVYSTCIVVKRLGEKADWFSTYFSTLSFSLKVVIYRKIIAAFCLRGEGGRGPENIQVHLKCAVRLVLICFTCICRHQPQRHQLLSTRKEVHCAVPVLSCEVDGRKTRSLVGF